MTDNIETEPKPKPKPIQYTYEERQAIAVVRKSMRAKPEIVTEIMRDAGYEMASRVLIQTQKELNQLLAVSQAFSEAASVIAKHQQESEKEQRT